MTIAIERRHFSQAVRLAASVVERRNTIPALGMLKAIANGSFALEGTDLDTFTRVVVPYIGDHAAFCLPEPMRLSAMVNAAGGEVITLNPKGDHELGLASGALAAELKTISADDHPGIDILAEERFGCDLGVVELGQIARIMPAISTEETRYYLNGICVWHLGDWTYRFASTDGHRLMMVDIPLPGALGELPGKPIMPKRFLIRALAAFAASKDAIRLSWGPKVARNEHGVQIALPETGNRLSLAGTVREAHLTMTTKLIDGTYPDVMRVVPTAVPYAARLQRSVLAQAVNALTPFSSEKTRAVKLKFSPGAVSLELNSPDLGAGRFTLECEHDLPDGFDIGFNARYLLEGLAALRGGEVVLGLTDSSAPTVIEDPSDTAFRCILMPMRV